MHSRNTDATCHLPWWDPHECPQAVGWYYILLIGHLYWETQTVALYHCAHGEKVPDSGCCHNLLCPCLWPCLSAVAGRPKWRRPFLSYFTSSRFSCYCPSRKAHGLAETCQVLVVRNTYHWGVNQELWSLVSHDPMIHCLSSPLNLSESGFLI